MARKSSFLQGFEVGADLYNRGFSQAQSMAQMKLQQDAQEERKKRLAMEIEEFKAIKEERQRKLDNRKLAFGRLDAFRSFVQDTKMDFKKPEDVRSMYEVLRTFRPEIDRDPEAAKALSGWLEGIERTEGANLIKWAEEEKKATLHYNVTQKLSKQAADNKLVSDFNNNWGTHYTTNEIPEINKWKRQIATMEETARKTGVIDSASFGDFEGFDQLSSHLDGIAAGQQALRKQGVEDTAAAQALAARQKEEWAKRQQELEKEEAFNAWRENKGKEGLAYGDPASMKIYRTSVQRENLISEIDWDNVSGNVVAMLATLPEEPNGGYSDETVAKFKAELGRMEGGEMRRRMPKDDASAKSLLFSEIMLFNQNIMEQIEMQGGLPGTANLIDSYLKDGVLGKLGNYAIDSKTQQYINAADNFIAAVLRKESGAAITEQERRDYWPQYIPVPGDKPEVIRQKLAARQNFMEGTRGASGLRWEDTAETRVAPPPVPFNSKQDLIDAFESGQLSVGDKYAYYDSSNNVIIGKVEGEEEPEPEPVQPAPTQPAQDQPDPAPNQMAPTGTPEGQPAPRQLPEVEGDAARGQTDMQVYQTPQPDEELERVSSETGQPVGIEPEMPMVIGDEFRTSGEITEDQLQESEVMREFQDLASNGGGDNPYAFRRHRVKIGNTTGEIVRTNSRGVFIKIPHGPTRFMSWGALSSRIESGDFKPNKARLNQQLKGE